MSSEYAKNEKELIERYQKKGYSVSYRLEKEKLIDLTTEKSYKPKQIYVVATHRYEGMSDPSDMSILYILETKDGSKGTILVGYGPSGDLELSDFFKAIPEKNCSEKENILENNK